MYFIFTSSDNNDKFKCYCKYDYNITDNVVEQPMMIRRAIYFIPSILSVELVDEGKTSTGNIWSSLFYLGIYSNY